MFGEKTEKKQALYWDNKKKKNKRMEFVEKFSIENKGLFDEKDKRIFLKWTNYWDSCLSLSTLCLILLRCLTTPNN